MLHLNYDLTNTFFEGKAAGISKAKHGRSKEKRSDCRLITLGMVVDELGFSKRSNILDGSVSEPHTFIEMIESAFRSLKHELAFRPIYHQTGLRAEAHIFIAVLAYHLLNAIGHELRCNGVTSSWNTVRSTLSNHRRVTVTGLTTHKKMYSKRITSKADPSHLLIYNALNLNPNPRIKPIKNGKM